MTIIKGAILFHLNNYLFNSNLLESQLYTYKSVTTLKYHSPG